MVCTTKIEIDILQNKKIVIRDNSKNISINEIFFLYQTNVDMHIILG